jgi:hypothetical protein
MVMNTVEEEASLETAVEKRSELNNADYIPLMENMVILRGSVLGGSR